MDRILRDAQLARTPTHEEALEAYSKLIDDETATVIGGVSRRILRRLLNRGRHFKRVFLSPVRADLVRDLIAMEQQFAKVQDRALDNPLAEQLSYSFTDVLSRTRNQMREFVRVILVLRAEVQKLTNENEETRHALSVGKLLLEKDMNRGLDCCPFCAEKTRVGGVGHENGCSLRPDIYCSREDCPLCEQDADEQDADEQDPSS